MPSLRHCLELAGVFGTSSHARSIAERARTYVSEDGYEAASAERMAVQDHLDHLDRQLDSVWQQAGLERPKSKDSSLKSEVEIAATPSVASVPEVPVPQSAIGNRQSAIEVTERHLSEARAAVADLRGEERPPDLIDELEGQVTSGAIRVPADMQGALDASRERVAGALHNKPFKRLSSAQRRRIDGELRVSTTEGMAADEVIPGLGEKYAGISVDDFANAILDAGEGRLLERKKGDSAEVKAMAEEIARAEAEASEIVSDWDQAAASTQAEAGLIRGSAAEKWADNVIAESQKRVNTGLDPELLAAYAVKGAALIEHGVVDFTAWSADMVKKFGAKLQPHLEDVWRETRFQVARNFHSREVANREGSKQESRSRARGNSNGGGYVGYSMSVRANNAYADGKLPASKGAAELGITPTLFRQLFQASEWHHTSKHFNSTDFFDMPAIWERIASEPELSLRIRAEMKSPAKKQEWWHRAVEARLNNMYERLGEDHASSWVNRPEQFTNRQEGRTARFIELGNKYAKNELNLQASVEKRLEGKPLTEANYLEAIDFVKAARADGFSIAELPSGNPNRDLYELNRLKERLAEGEAAFARGIRAGNGKPFTTDNQRQNALDSMAKRRRLIAIYENANPAIAGGAAGIKTPLESRAESGAAGETLRLDSRLNDVNQSNILPESQRGKAVVGNASQMVSSATTPEASNSVKLENALDSLKLDTNGQLHAFGLLPEAWNTLIDLVKLGVKTGRTIQQAVDWAISQFKDANKDVRFEEAGAREELLKLDTAGLRPAEGQGIRTFPAIISQTGQFTPEVLAGLRDVFYGVETETQRESSARSIIEHYGPEEAYSLYSQGDTKLMPDSYRETLGAILANEVQKLERQAIGKGERAEADKLITLQQRILSQSGSEGSGLGQTFGARKAWYQFTPLDKLEAARDQFENVKRRAWDRIKPAVDAAVDRLNTARRGAVDDLTRDPKANETVRTAVDEGIKSEIENPKSEIHKAVVMELAEPWAQSEYILNTAREHVRAKANELLNNAPRPAHFTPAQHLRQIMDDVAKRAAGIFTGHIQGAEPGVGIVEKLQQRLGLSKEHAQKLASSLSKEWDRQLDIAKKNLDTRLAKQRARQAAGLPADASAPTVDQLLRQHLRKANLALGQLARQSADSKATTGKSLADEIVKATGATGDAATTLHDKLTKRFEELLKTRAASELKKLDPGQHAQIQSKGVAEKLLEAVNLGALDNETAYNLVREKYKLPVFTPELQREVLRRANEIDAVPKDQAQRRFKLEHELLEWLINQRGVNLWRDVVPGIFYSSMLSNPLTHGRNFVFTGITGLADNFVTILHHAAMGDFGAAQTIWDSAQRGMSRGGLDAAESLRSGAVSKHGEKLEMPRAFPSFKFQGKYAPVLNPILFALYKWQGRALTAEDLQWFRPNEEIAWGLAARRVAREQGLRGKFLDQAIADMLSDTPVRTEQARAQAVTEGYTGGTLDYRRRVYEILDHSRDAKLPANTRENVVQYALRNTVNNEPYGVLGYLAKTYTDAATKAYDLNAGLGFAMDVIVPFRRIVANVLNESLNWTPVGNARAWRSGKTGTLYGQPVLDPQAAGHLHTKAIVGTMALLGIYALTQQTGDDGQPLLEISGLGPADPNKRQMWKDGGNQSYHVKIGGKSFTYLNTPLGYPLAVMGSYQDAIKYRGLDKQDADERLAYVMQSGMRAWLDQSFLSGTQDFLEMMSRDSTTGGAERFTKGAARTAATVAIPNKGFLDFVDRSFNPEKVDTSTVRAGLVAAVPFARHINKPLIDALGKVITVGLLDNEAKWQTPDPLYVLLARQQAWPSTPSKDVFVGDKARGEDFYRALTPDERYDYIAESGWQLRQRLAEDMDKIAAMDQPTAKAHVQNLAEEERKKVLDRVRF